LADHQPWHQDSLSSLIIYIQEENMFEKKIFKTFLAGFFLAFLFTPVLFAGPDWISLNGNSTEEKPSVLVQDSNHKETVIEFQLRGFQVDEIEENQTIFQTLKFPGYPTTLEIGKPELPAITELIAIPARTKVKVSVVDSSVMILKGYKVYPFQKPLLEGEETREFNMDALFYSQDAFYPAEIAEVDEPQIWRDVRVVGLRVYPIQYNPVTEELRIYRNLTIKLEYFGTSRINVLSSSERRIEPACLDMYRTLILNDDFLSLDQSNVSDRRDSREDYDFLIITVDLFEDELTPLKAWKESKATPIQTQITTLSTIGENPSADDIKNYINQEYTAHNIQWVLLVGDIVDLPIYTGYPDRISDYWYALLDGNDNLPEIAVGRFSTASESEVSLIVNKTIAYEDNPTGNWIDNALLVAHEEDSPGKYEGCKEDVRLAVDTLSGTYRAKFPVFSTAYGASGASNQDVINAINAGQAVVNYRGHGSQTAWTDWNTGNEYFDSTDIAALDNGERTPVVFSIACSNNKLDASGNCFGEDFTQTDDAAVAFLGATRPSYTSPNHTYDKQLFATIFDEGTQNIGNASNIAAVRIIQNHGVYGSRNAQMYLWLGDPSLTIPLREDPTAYHWLILIDISGSMHGERLNRAKNWAIAKVDAALTDENDQVALATFEGYSGYRLIEDWTRDREILISSIEGLWAGGMTPLADAACEAAQKLIDDVTDPGARRFVLLSDGNENYSTGACSGNPDPDPNPPWCDSESSWHCSVWTKLVHNMILDVGFFGELGATRSDGGDDEMPENRRSIQDFLQDLAAETGGTYTDPVELCGNGILEADEECEVGYPCNMGDYNQFSSGTWSGTKSSAAMFGNASYQGAHLAGTGGPDHLCINCRCVKRKHRPGGSGSGGSGGPGTSGSISFSFSHSGQHHHEPGTSAGNSSAENKVEVK